MTIIRARVGLITAAVAVGGLAVAATVYVRTMCRPGYVPQIDAPLWRGTDQPAPDPAGLAGAILALGSATDETTARYWLAMCARRGADWDLQRVLWETWQDENERNVTYLYSDPTDPEEQDQ